MTAIRLLLVDDDPLVRAGLALMLGGAEDVEIVGEAADGDEVGGLVDGTRPDVVLRDIRMPVVEGLTNARKHAPGQPVHMRLSKDDGVEIELSNAFAEGAETFPGAGAGLAGLRERVTLLGGRLSFGCTPQARFRLHAWIPSQS
jgi:DNA-binding NarL/FixJ family response regulator